MADFQTAVAYVLDNEGVDSNDAADSGGRTRFGITAAEAARHGFDVTKLTLDQAKGIYREDYWRFDLIDNQRVATKLLDMAVNLGLATAIRMAQKAVGVADDGAIGLITVKAVNGAPSSVLLDKLVRACVMRYADIVAGDHTQAVFIRGWMDRALRVPA